MANTTYKITRNAPPYLEEVRPGRPKAKVWATLAAMEVNDIFDLPSGNIITQRSYVSAFGKKHNRRYSVKHIGSQKFRVRRVS